jgi:hypothetical protein
MLQELEHRNLGREVYSDSSTLIRVFRVERSGPQCTEVLSRDVPQGIVSAAHRRGQFNVERR